MFKSLLLLLLWMPDGRLLDDAEDFMDLELLDLCSLPVLLGLSAFPESGLSSPLFIFTSRLLLLLWIPDGRLLEDADDFMDLEL